jgi:hypothetical protein
MPGAVAYTATLKIDIEPWWRAASKAPDLTGLFRIRLINLKTGKGARSSGAGSRI